MAYRLYSGIGCFHSRSESADYLRELCSKERGGWTICDDNTQIVDKRDGFGTWDKMNRFVDIKSNDRFVYAESAAAAAIALGCSAFNAQRS